MPWEPWMRTAGGERGGGTGPRDRFTSLIPRWTVEPLGSEEQPEAVGGVGGRVPDGRRLKMENSGFLFDGVLFLQTGRSFPKSPHPGIETAGTSGPRRIVAESRLPARRNGAKLPRCGASPRIERGGTRKRPRKPDHPDARARGGLDGAFARPEAEASGEPSARFSA